MRRSLWPVSAVLAALMGAVVAFPTSAQLVVGSMGGMATYGGFWIDKDGTTRIPGMIAQPASGNFTEAAVTTTVGTGSTTILNANPRGRRIALFIELNTVGTQIACTDDGTTPALYAGTAITISGQGAWINYAAFGMVPAGAIICIASASSTITVRSL